MPTGFRPKRNRSSQKSPVPHAKSRTVEPGSRERPRTVLRLQPTSIRKVIKRLMRSYRGAIWSNICSTMMAFSSPWGRSPSLGTVKLDSKDVYVYARYMHSATHAGRSEPSISNTKSAMYCAPPSNRETSLRLAPMRTFAPTGTGAVKRSLFAP